MSARGDAADDAPAKQPHPDPLPIRSLEFLGPMAEAGGWRPTHDWPEIAFSGRSNVGKSSLINKLVKRKALARVSKTPGRTREINFFEVNKTFVIADLPGYGYAKISKERQEAWRPLIEGFLRGSARLAGIVQLLDIRRELTEEDEQMFELLGETEVPTLIVVTKADKLSKGAAAAAVKKLARQLRVDEEQILPFSAVTGEGRDELAEAVVALVAEASGRPQG